jgi:hypothetical protein
MGWVLRIVIGIALFALGVFVAVRPLFVHGATLTGTRWLDMAFALVFMLRGAVNVRSALRRQRGMNR